jgi:hypothetical protein
VPEAINFAAEAALPLAVFLWRSPRPCAHCFHKPKNFVRAASLVGEQLIRTHALDPSLSKLAIRNGA